MSKRSFDSTDLTENRVTGGLGYLVFFLPLILCPQSKYGRFCANQGLWLLIAQVALWLVFLVLHLVIGWVPLVGWILNLVGNLAHIAVALLAIYLTYLACVKGDARTVPGVGERSLIH